MLLVPKSSLLPKLLQKAWLCGRLSLLFPCVVQAMSCKGVLPRLKPGAARPRFFADGTGKFKRRRPESASHSDQEVPGRKMRLGQSAIVDKAQ